MFCRTRTLVGMVLAFGMPPILTAQAGRAAITGKVDCASQVGDHETMDHSAHAAIMSPCATPLPKLPGQAALGAIAEIVRLLRDDPATDWSRVNIEALRQHLIEMNEVAMHAHIVQRDIPGGLSADITGTGTTVAAIRHIAVGHSTMLSQDPRYLASAVVTTKGARVTVTARDPADSMLIAQIRGLGFAGLLTEGDHHARHHVALARGDDHPHGH